MGTGKSKGDAGTLSKEIIGASAYVPASYLTVADFLRTFGITDATTLTADLTAKYTNYVNSGNRSVEMALKKYSDKLPLQENSDIFSFARDMAYYWAKHEKQVEEGSPTVGETLKQWEITKEQLIESIQATPAQTTQRTVVSSGFEDPALMPFSQTYGVEDFL